MTYAVVPSTCGSCDWVKGYERTWSERFELLDDVLDELMDDPSEEN